MTALDTVTASPAAPVGHCRLTGDCPHPGAVVLPAPCGTHPPVPMCRAHLMQVLAGGGRWDCPDCPAPADTTCGADVTEDDYPDHLAECRACVDRDTREAADELHDDERRWV